MPLPSEPPPEIRFPAVLGWLVPPGYQDEYLRQARTVLLIASLAVVTFGALALAFALMGLSVPQVAQASAAALLCVAALALVRADKIEAAAWLTALTLMATPIAQAALDAGIRDPGLALVAVAPLVAAMMSGLRMAVWCAALGAIGALLLLLNYLGHTETPPVSSADALAWYAFVLAGVGSFASAVTGAVYVRHTRSMVAEAEAHSVTLNSALRESEARYRSLVDGLPVGVYRTGPDGQVLFANPALADMLGVSSVTEALHVNAAALYDDPAKRVAFQKAISKSGFVQRYETEWHTPGGVRRQVRIDARVERGPDGEVLYYEGAVEDVTAARRARAALAHSEARFRALVQRSSDLVVVVDAGGRLAYVSPASKALLGTDYDRLVGRDALAIVHPDDQATARAMLGRAAEQTAETPLFEIRLRHADGHFIYAEGVGTALYHDPAVEGLVLSLRDVTERKRAQTVLVQAKKQAEEVAHLKSTFLANMSHEIRTPLTAILGFSDILADEVTDPQQQEFVDLIARSGRRLMDTLNSVLDLARLEAGRGELVCTPLRVADAVEEAVALLQPAAATAGLTLVAAIEAPAAVAALDDAAFARVLHNLAGNALKFTEAGGVTVRVAQDGSRVVVRVEDTGIGIDEAFLPRLFGEFEQASAGVERTHEGAGLGLAISHQLVGRMQGTIEAESTRGVGTVFTLSFPLVGGDTRPARAPAAPRRRVLVVDDSDQARAVAERVLEAHYNVDTAESGAEALAHARASRPDAILLDIHLGDTVSGEDVLRDLRADPVLAGLPVVAVTAYGLPGDHARFLGLGFDDYVTKPYTRERLLHALELSLERRVGAPVL